MLTVAALGLTVYSGTLGTKIYQNRRDVVEGTAHRGDHRVLGGEPEARVARVDVPGPVEVELGVGHVFPRSR